MFILQRRMFLFAAAAVMAVLCCGCSENEGYGIGWIFWERKLEKIERDDISNYDTVRIGAQLWTKQNLNIETGNNWCYGNDPANCEIYGRLYNWFTAMRICPAGWRLPTSEDWNVLLRYADWSGAKLKSKDYWTYWDGWNEVLYEGTDDYGFSALPGGRGFGYNFNEADSGGYWWKATEGRDNRAYYQSMRYNEDYVRSGTSGKTERFSVRCVKDG